MYTRPYGDTGADVVVNGDTVISYTGLVILYCCEGDHIQWLAALI